MTFNIKWAAYSLLILIGIALNLQRFAIEQWMIFSLRNETVVVSFSTTPHRIKDIRPTIQSIFDQNYKPSKIYISIPYVFKRDNISYVIPEWIENDKRLTILRSEDYGPATKLLGALKNVNLPENAIIITFDDDIPYPKNTILQLAYKAFQNPDSAIGLSGANPIYDKQGKLSNEKPDGIDGVHIPDAKVSILQGFAGIAYRRSFFDDTIYNITQAPRECINSDDLYLSFYLAKHNIQRIVLINKYISKHKINFMQEIGYGGDALHNLIPAPIDKHQACISYMHSLDPDVVF